MYINVSCNTLTYDVSLVQQGIAQYVNPSTSYSHAWGFLHLASSIYWIITHIYLCYIHTYISMWHVIFSTMKYHLSKRESLRRSSYILQSRLGVPTVCVKYLLDHNIVCVYRTNTNNNTLSTAMGATTKHC